MDFLLEEEVSGAPEARTRTSTYTPRTFCLTERTRRSQTVEPQSAHSSRYVHGQSILCGQDMLVILPCIPASVSSLRKRILFGIGVFKRQTIPECPSLTSRSNLRSLCKCIMRNATSVFLWPIITHRSCLLAQNHGAVIRDRGVGSTSEHRGFGMRNIIAQLKSED